MGEHERATPQVEHVELDQVDAGCNRSPKRAEGVLGSEGSCATMADSKHVAVRTTKVDHEALRGAGLIRRSHARATRATRIACATTITAVSTAVSRQKTSG